MTICHIPTNPETGAPEPALAVTIVIKTSEWPEHEAHGDVIGACPVDCLNTPFGIAVYDICGVCAGDNSTCGGCVLDCCGVCNGDGSTCKEKCETFDISKQKKKVAKNSKVLFRSVKKYSTAELRCDKAKKAIALKRILTAQKLWDINTQMLSEFMSSTIKVCDTPFCKKSSFVSILKTTSEGIKKMYQLSRKAQYAAEKACKTRKQKARRRSGSESAKNSAINNINKIPSEQCN